MTTVETIGQGGDMKYSDAVVAPNGKLYCIPHRIDYMGVLVPGTGTFSRLLLHGDTPAPFQSHSGNLWAAGHVGPNGRIYLVPMRREYFGIFDPLSDTAEAVEHGAIPGTDEQWLGAVLVDGVVYCVPGEQPLLGIFDTQSLDYASVDMSAALTSNSWAGWFTHGVHVNGIIYMTPCLPP